MTDPDEPPPRPLEPFADDLLNQFSESCFFSACLCARFASLCVKL